MVVEEEALDVACPDIVVTQNEEAMPELTPSCGFSEEQLQLIFDLRRDVVDQLFFARISSVVVGCFL
jgi:hypothetical protein